MKREINLKTSRQQLFRQYVEICKPLLGITNKRTLDVLALLLFYNDEKKDIKNIDDRFKVIFDYDIKMEIAESLGVSMYSINNEFSNLRKKDIIIQYTKINPNILIYPDDTGFTLPFNFTIENGKEEKA